MTDETFVAQIDDEGNCPTCHRSMRLPTNILDALDQVIADHQETPPTPMTDELEGAPLGAIENGREHFRRLVGHYKFVEENGHQLGFCLDFLELGECFTHLVEHIRISDKRIEELKRALHWIANRSDVRRVLDSMDRPTKLDMEALHDCLACANAALKADTT